MKIIYFGTPEFSAHVLDFLLKNGVEVAAVVTKPDKPVGRSKTPVPTPVKLIAEKSGIPLYQPAIVSELDFAPTLQQYNADLFVAVAYGEIIKQHLLDMPKQGCINLHTSLLPKYRGAAPIQRSILNGDSKTGVTIIHMVKKMDAGDMIKVVETPIDINDSFPEVEKRLCEIGGEALLDVIRNFEELKNKSIPQNHEQATLAPKIELEDCQIFWNKPATELHNLIRAVVPEPGAWCIVEVKGEKKRLKIFSSRVIENINGLPGQILAYGKKDLIIGCEAQALQLLDVQLEGKKAMTASEMMRGIPQDQIIVLN